MTLPPAVGGYIFGAFSAGHVILRAVLLLSVRKTNAPLYRLIGSPWLVGGDVLYLLKLPCQFSQLTPRQRALSCSLYLTLFLSLCGAVLMIIASNNHSNCTQVTG